MHSSVKRKLKLDVFFGQNIFSNENDKTALCRTNFSVKPNLNSLVSFLWDFRCFYIVTPKPFKVILFQRIVQKSIDTQNESPTRIFTFTVNISDRWWHWKRNEMPHLPLWWSFRCWKSHRSVWRTNLKWQIQMSWGILTWSRSSLHLEQNLIAMWLTFQLKSRWPQWNKECRFGNILCGHWPKWCLQQSRP